MKKCVICHKSKHKKYFYKNRTNNDGLQNLCKLCCKFYSKKNYYKDKSAHINRVAKNKTEYKKDIQTYICEYLSHHPCVDCGEPDIRCLDFDHLKNKISPVSYMIKSCCSIPKIEREIKKCDVRCANCHRKKTSDDQNWYRSKYISEL